MKRSATSIAVLATLIALPLGAHAVTYEFVALMKGANEVPSVTASATGIALLTYDTKNTAALEDDTFDFTLTASGLTGVANGFHIHTAASTTEMAPVTIDMFAMPSIFTALNTGNGVLLVGASGVSAPALIPATLPAAANQGYPAMSFLAALQGGLAYVNVHTVANRLGEARGQLMQVGVSPVPEPSTYAMLLGGLVVLGFAFRRRSRS